MGARPLGPAAVSVQLVAKPLPDRLRLSDPLALKRDAALVCQSFAAAPLAVCRRRLSVDTFRYFFQVRDVNILSSETKLFTYFS